MQVVSLQWLTKIRKGSTIEIRMEKAVDVVARWVCAGTRGSELSTYPRRRR